MEITKADWKLFQDKIPFWQESYIARLNQEYVSILTNDGNPSDKFWQLEKRIKQDKKNRGVVIQVQKQSVVYDLAALINDGVITFSDIAEFSHELQEKVRYLCNHSNATC